MAAKSLKPVKLVESANNDRLSPAVDRALSILEAISEGNPGLTNAQLARRLGIPKSSVSSILSVMQERGYACRFPENGRYRLGFKFLTLGRRLLDTSVIRDLALPFMRELVDRVDLTCHLAILGQNEAVHYEKIVARRNFKQDRTRAIGDRVPLHASSVGKALLAWQTPPALEVYLPGNVNGLRRISPRTITDRASLLGKLEEVRRQGYAVDDQECRLGWRCVGAPIFDQWGSTRVAICLTGTVEELETERLTPTASAVMETAHKISLRLAMEHVEFATY